jgi:hypothetical protein
MTPSCPYLFINHLHYQLIHITTYIFTYMTSHILHKISYHSEIWNQFNWVSSIISFNNFPMDDIFARFNNEVLIGYQWMTYLAHVSQAMVYCGRKNLCHWKMMEGVNCIPFIFLLFLYIFNLTFLKLLVLQSHENNIITLYIQE